MKSLDSIFAARRGTALVVVLMFVALMTVVALAFFMKSTSFRSLSQSGVNDFKADTLARSALEMTVGDLKQEIVNGSEAVVSGTNTLYLPKTPLDMVPRRSGNPALSGGVDPVPNLVRRSVRSDAIAAPGVPSRASASSSLDPSRTRKFISGERWNKHYLVPRKNAGSTSISTEPVADFVVPDWVYLTENGAEVLTTSGTSVIGRYAYAIYDEGGLLDINVAGYPANTPLKAVDTGDTHGTVWGSGNKGGVASADLTVLGLTQKEIDQIVGWRTAASTQPTGIFPNLTFSSASAQRYHDSSRPHPYNFINVSGTTATVGGKAVSDQLFTSRQQLLNFRNRVGFSQDALQYLGTFSRDIEQPSFIPNPNRPKVRANATNNSATYGTGNDAFNGDRETNRAEDINPPFPLVRVKSEFTRPDGTTARVGDPLVKRRFPLSRLKQILHTATASKSQSDSIYRDFGIYRSNTSQPWQYDHGDPTGILRLDKVAAESREPDFFELLKAGINVGSIAKGAAYNEWNVAGTYAELQHNGHDVLANLQILQIGANVIDQFDSDGFPTRIAFSGDSVKEVRGIESLPYLYRLRLRFVKEATIPANGSDPASYPGTIFLNPEVWNPHGSEPPSDGPTQFRIRAESTLGSGMPTSMTFVYAGTPATEVEKIVNWSAGGALSFQSDGTLFREPTVLAMPNVPAGSSLAGPTRTDTLAPTPYPVTGIVVTDFETQVNGKAVNDAYLGRPDPGPVTISLEYYDGGAYRIYDQQTVAWSASKFSPKTYWGDYEAKNKYDGWVRTDPRTSRWGANKMELLYLIPPINSAGLIFPSGWPSLTIPPFAPKGDWPRDNGFINSFSNASNNDNAPNHESRHRGFAQGFWTQNTTRNQAPFFNVEAKPFYTRDPDGIARRAMGGYSSDANAGGSSTTSDGLPMITANNASRPLVLNRPFRSVAELGYTFRGTPWRNIDVSFPESGDAALMDIFSVDEIGTDSAVVAGKVNLNTRQVPVLQALMAGSVTNDLVSSPSSVSSALAKSIAEKLTERTSSTDPAKGPLTNRSDLVGRWTGTGGSPSTANSADPDASYSGFSLDIGTVVGLKGTTMALIPAQREAALRALVDAGGTRVWNLMIDLVAQSGRFPTQGAGLDTFQVEGEKRYWLHIAIDRLTGEVLDRQLEIVTE